ncbi:beta-1,3-galactosyltransferase brn [Ischnura elegans]|uniref:beta-1,3-galactosyltransferase brn n=1 Tax=Ischnura elegans TaxID=197161 RepID=UPI001ED88D5C|nr:beta-1,3-galactosyltransferase brn [Ischnura elegans]
MYLRMFKRVTCKTIILAVLIIFVVDFLGPLKHIFEKEFSSSFRYPYDGDINHFVDQLERGEKPDVAPINIYNYTFLLNCDHKCKLEASSPRLVYLVKSALDNFHRRQAIRNSWGFEGRFSDVITRRVFVLGVSKNDAEIQKRILKEHLKYRDIVQANFVDAYYNNTIKTMMGFKWAMEYCPNARVYFFSDDDMYISTKNVLRFIRNPTHYPHYLESPIISLDQNRRKRSVEESNTSPGSSSVLSENYAPSLKTEAASYLKVWNQSELDSLKSIPSNSLHELINSTISSVSRRPLQVVDFDLPDDALLWAGYVFYSSPHRHKSSRWYVSLSEYPYDRWPPYVTAGAFVLSQNAFRLLYFASMYTKHFRFDDIFLGLAAAKVGLEPFHSDDFHFYPKDYSVSGYRYVVASHGYGNPKELLDVWNEQRSAGNA